MSLLDDFFQNLNSTPAQQGNNNATRDLGQGLKLTKPDGTPIVDFPINLSINKNLAEVVTNLNPARPTDKIKDGKSTTETEQGKTAVKGGVNLQNIVPNPLENFASYTPLWTMACLTPEQFNKPSTYRTNSPSALKNIVFSSGGRFDDQRVKTLFGSPEYYVNNFVMQSIISASPKTGNSNAVKFSFEIYEPYSMGLLLQSFQIAAINAGYTNYLDNAPYVLRLDFLGYNELGQKLGSKSDTGNFTSAVKPKFFVCKLTSVKFEVNEGGSTYKVEAIPFNHQAFADTTSTLYSDINIRADKEGTVEELLVKGEHSLCSVLNKNEQRLVEEERIKVPDVYEIQFPEKSSDFIPTTQLPITKRATSSTKDTGERKPIKSTAVATRTDFGNNPIGKSVFGFDQSTGGNFTFRKEGDVIDSTTGKVQRDKMTIDPKTRSFHFSQKQSINDIIVQAVLSSEYSKAALDPDNLEDGFIKWFRIDVQIEFLDFDDLVGDYAKKIIFRVVPFRVHHSLFSNPNSPGIGFQQLEKKIVKQYKYIYTGENVDILKFDITINNLFYTGQNTSPESASGSVVNQNQNGVAQKEVPSTRTGKGTSAQAQTANSGRSRPLPNPARLKRRKGGHGQTTVEREVAMSFHEAFVEGSSADLVSVDLEILGDTYWLVDGGMANHFSKPVTENALITEDGTANYEGSDVYIYIVFKTPTDINVTKGMYEFAKAGAQSPFSGIYRVTQVESQFTDGMFKQKLKCLRMQGQPSDYDDQALPTDKKEATATRVDGTEPPATSVSDESIKVPARLRR